MGTTVKFFGGLFGGRGGCVSGGGREGCWLGGPDGSRGGREGHWSGGENGEDLEHFVGSTISFASLLPVNYQLSTINCQL